ncbi:MAG: helix-turn-helix domain-containing protein, partial [Halobacteriota archaeon]
MKSLQLDMVQYDCPYIETTIAHDVTFYATQWDFKHDRRALETHILMAGEREETIERSISKLRQSEHFRSVDLLSKKGSVAELRSSIDETKAMRTILENDGYIVGPFVIDDGSELWNIGFDRAADADVALAELDKNNEFTVESESTIDLVDYYDITNNVEALRDVIVGLRELTDTETQTLRAAV